MDKDYPQDPALYNRLDTDLAQKDPADRNDSEDNDIERRDRMTAIIDSIDPQPQTPTNPDVVYGETDLDPHRDDQRDAHHSDAGDIA
ncbi:MAG TPA: hypothetical protein VFN49_13730 [Candidatus Aquilonibacter sp.]|nr:hypothetical protein [Candidatus Aquilonibacter sp.]